MSNRDRYVQFRLDSLYAPIIEEAQSEAYQNLKAEVDLVEASLALAREVLAKLYTSPNPEAESNFKGAPQ